jgi:hypothetical protein
MAVSDLLALLSLIAAGRPGAESARLTTPPLPPGVVCGSMPALDLGAVPLTAETRLAEVVSAWGQPYARGPAGEMSLYWLTCDAQLWLSFEPGGERRLTRAILFTGSFVPTARIILNRLDITRHRSCGQVRSGRGRSGREIVRAWGPPDNQIGSGVVRWTYEMADGGFAQVFPMQSRRFLVRCAPGRRGD